MPLNSPAVEGLVGIRDEVIALKRERTIETAAILFYERGYENTSLDAIAERMNVTKPFIYSHFASKSELLAEICSRGTASALESIENIAFDQCISPRTTLEQVARSTAVAVLRNQRYIGVFAREQKNLVAEDYIRIKGMQRRFDHRLVELLDAGVAAGEFEIFDTRFTALSISGMISWAYVWYRSDGRLNADEISDRFAGLIMTMVRAPVLPVKTKSPRTGRR